MSLGSLVTSSPSTPTAQPGSPLTQTPELFFLGPRIHASHDGTRNRSTITADTSVMGRMATWNAAFSYIENDVVDHLGATWINRGGTSNVGEPSIDDHWLLLKGPAMMTTAQMALWVAPRDGDTVFDTDLDQLFVREGAVWQPVSTSLVVQEEGVDLPVQPKLNFAGQRITVTDDAANGQTDVALSDHLLNYTGSWTAAGSYCCREVVRHNFAWWAWVGAAPSVPGVMPGTTSTDWQQFTGIPPMSQAEIDAYTSALNGSTVWNKDKKAMYYRDTGVWLPVNPSLSQWAARTGNIGIATGSGTTLAGATLSGCLPGRYQAIAQIIASSTVATTGIAKIATGDSGESPTFLWSTPIQAAGTHLVTVNWQFDRTATGSLTVNLHATANAVGVAAMPATNVSFTYLGAV